MAINAAEGNVLTKPPIKLDPIDLKLLAAIEREGRITKLKLAEKVGLSPTPCWNRLKRLEESGIVAGYHARIEWRLVAPQTAILVEITLGQHRQADFDRFEKVVREAKEVVACWSVGGGVDYILKIAARDVEAYQQLIDGWLEREIGIARYFTYIVTRTVKDGPSPPANDEV
ncbi:Lrp/AsnC family transcriptional regulator [Jiella endophytica]|uniref:Lrp/AsnC family transcriptional regulator n=1 Tax=Jiella endophytica TaxID=2558362 RepID=A0A4Y8RV72_9HYPH|nr:Lrp/AsnC family transcriptional regulator [Jiella endophytica]TFF27863.1 Lrp/AsnC family transcriptional regulator [Jiella endophytica]